MNVTVEEILGLFSVAKREQTWFHFQGKIQIFFFFLLKTGRCLVTLPIFMSKMDYRVQKIFII